MLKVKAQRKGQLYRSRHKREQLNLLLKKQLSTKPTRQPTRFALENRNHGLAWSQSGNNKAGALWAKRGERGILREALRS